LDDVTRALMMWILRGIVDGIVDVETSSYFHFHVINNKVKWISLIIIIYK